MNRLATILWLLLVLLLINAGVLAGCDVPVPRDQSPTATVAVTPIPMISPTRLAVIPTTSPSATKTPAPEPAPTLTPSPSLTPRQLDLPGVIYLHFRPKTEYDQREYPYRGKLYQVDPNTGQTSPLLTDEVQTFATSPDGSQLAYTRRDAQGTHLLVRSLADGKDEVIYAGPEETWGLVWSPDGRALAYVLQRVSGEQLLVRNLVNGTDVVLIAGPGYIMTPIWSPDGRELAATQYTADSWMATGTVWVVGADGQSARQIAEGFDPAWSPDGQNLAYVTRLRVPPDAQNSLEIVDRFGKNRQVIFDTDPQTWKAGQHILMPQLNDGPRLASPSWSPDGRYLLFAVGGIPAGLYRIQLDSGAMIELATIRRYSVDGEFLNGSDRILAGVTATQGWAGLYDLVVTKQGEVSRSLINRDTDTATGEILSPDKRYVAYIATDDGYSRLTFVLYDLQMGQELLRRNMFEDTEKPYFTGYNWEWAPR